MTFKCCDTTETHDRIMFGFYPEHNYVYTNPNSRRYRANYKTFHYLYSSYKMFRRLCTEYESRPSEDSILPQHLTPGGYIDPEVSLPIGFVANNLPQLRVSACVISFLVPT